MTDKVAVISPDWLKKNAIYQVNLRTFSKEGTIRSLISHLDEIKELGFGIIYICPVFKEDETSDRRYWSKRQLASNTENPKNPYKISDYFEIDEEYGTPDDLKEFVNKAHRLDIKVLLDAVYLHCGTNSVMLSAHPEFAKRDANGNFLMSEWNYPELDFGNKGLCEYLISNMMFYICQVDVDGFRCDVGDRVPIHFWDEAKKRMTAVKPDSILIEEGINKDYLLSSFNGLYCFSWHEVLYSVLSSEKCAAAIKENYKEWYTDAPKGMLTLRDLDNHDTVTDWRVRSETVAGHDGMEMAIVLNYFIDGIPMIYSGNEIADEAKLSLFANRFYPGEYKVTDRTKTDTPACIRRRSIIKTLNCIKRCEELLLNGSTEWLLSDNDNIIAFSRNNQSEKITFIGNFSKDRLEVEIESFTVGNDDVVLLSSQNPPRFDGEKAVFSKYSYIVVKQKIK